LTAISRVTRTKAEARRTYDRLSRWYDALAGPSERRFTMRGLELLRVQPGERVLEIGCGTGHALVQLARTAGRAYGVDLSVGMEAVARRRIAAAGWAGAVHLGLADAARLPFAASAFDATFMSFTLELFDTPEIPLVLAECRRVLRPGGRLGVVSLARADNLAVRLYEWAHRHFPQAVDCRPILVQNVLEQSGFHINAHEAAAMWGLPVDIVVAD
jgi:demethylmenaquinone methyltransferase/2-methoxy-6-polyprenyl-1,4-benzoquinol methylase